MDSSALLGTRLGEATELELLKIFATSIAIGLLIGLERERHAEASSGLRTFALTALLGTACAMLAEAARAVWLPAAALVMLGAMSIAAQYRNSERRGTEADPGTTTTVALLVCFALGMMVWYELTALAASLAVGVTALLHFKPELEGMSARVTRRDMLSILQFGALSLVVLPVLPDRGYGPHEALNPSQIWMMVVLISGVSLAGYLALRIAGSRGLLLIGLFGGLVSSTATTLTYARRAREEPGQAGTAPAIVLIAGAVVFVRIAVLAAALAPPLLGLLGAVLAAGFVPMALAGLLALRRLPQESPAAALQVRNPAELRTALSFGAFYALVLLLAAELTHRLGSTGLYVIAFVSGLSDVDAVTLTGLRLHTVGSIPAAQVVIAIAVALCANIMLKFALVGSVGGQVLARRCAPGFAASAAGLLAAIAAVQLGGDGAALALRQ